MRITKYGHSCLLVEDGDARVLLDPGAFSSGFEDLRGLTAVLVTHQHADHLDIDRLLPLLEANDGVEVLADPESAQALIGRGLGVSTVDAGATRVLGGLDIEVIGSRHAVIHPDIPTVANVGYLLGGKLFHPGDAYTLPDRAIELLALPLVAPWTKLSETVDYLRAVRPRLALPIHDAIVSMPQVYADNVERLAPEGTALRLLDAGVPAEL